MIAWKFLSAGRIAPFTRYAWPMPGHWVEADGGAVVCFDGVHACRAMDLPFWVDDELWEVELDGAIDMADGKLAAERGRLTRRVAAWNAATADDYGLACTLRARDHALHALRRTGVHVDDLEHAFTVRAVANAARVAERDGPATARIATAFAADAADSALDGQPATAAYVAAHMAGVLRTAEAEEDERRWQAAWLAERLELPLDD